MATVGVKGLTNLTWHWVTILMVTTNGCMLCCGPGYLSML